MHEKKMSTNHTPSQHTPGPWRIEFPEISGRCPTLHDGTPYIEISGGCGYPGGADPGFQTTAYLSEADARLIAAAPELLEALNGMLDAQGDEMAMIDAIFNAHLARSKALNISPPEDGVTPHQNDSPSAVLGSNDTPAVNSSGEEAA